jgi:protein gp37
MAYTTIEWTDMTWNPVRGCSLVSAGCKNCYAMKQAHRFSGKGRPYEGLTELGPHGPRWTGKITLVPELLAEPLRWKKPRRVFVNSMSDLFHEDVPEAFLIAVFAVMMACPLHTFQILTKRPKRMCEYLLGLKILGGLGPYIRSIRVDGDRSIANFFNAIARMEMIRGKIRRASDDPWMTVFNAAACTMSNSPLPNVHLGVSVEDQQTADERIPILLKTPAAVRWISAEPLLGPVDLTKWTSPCACDPRVCSGPVCLDCVVIGGESTHGARPCEISWIRWLVQECQAAHVPIFVKQLGAVPYVGRELTGWPSDTLFNDAPNGLPGYIAKLKDKKGGDPSEWPEDLRVREWPC